jgi:fibronectin-binding autotransporter adhesin
MPVKYLAPSTVDAAADTVVVSLTPGTDGVIFLFSGTYTGLAGVFEGGTDGSTFPYPLAATRSDTGVTTFGTMTLSATNAAVTVNALGLPYVRFRATVVSTGEASVTPGTQGSIFQLSPVITVDTTDITATGTLAVTGAATLSSTLAVTGATTLSSTLGVTGLATLTGGSIVPDAATMAIGTGADLLLSWDGTRFSFTQAATNSEMRYGVDGAGIDQTWYGDTASTSLKWDQSADSLILTGAAPLVFTGTTGQPRISLTDNLADSLSIGISGAADLLVLTTTDNAEAVAVTGLRTAGTTAVAITGATTLKLSDSGGIFTVSQAAAYDIDLPSPTSGPGCRYFFSLTAAGANNVTITVAGSAATFVGSIQIDGATVVATGSTLTYATGASSLGDSIEIQSIATNLYHVRAMAAASGGITIS